MKLKRFRSRQGSVLVMGLVLAALIGVVLLGYLSMISNESELTARSQAWNLAMAVTEAGAEEAMAHVHKNGVTGSTLTTANLANEDWVFMTNVYYLRRALGENYYEVTIRPGATIRIVSRGYVQMPSALASSKTGAFMASTKQDAQQSYGLKTPGSKAKWPWESQQPFLTRAIEVRLKAQGRFTKAVVAKDKIQLNGKNVYVDSFHSYDPDGSTPIGTNAWGQYDPAKRRDGGDLAVIGGLKDELSVGKAKVYGKLSTGPQGQIKGDEDKMVVGSMKWHEDGNVGVQPGWSTSDVNFDMPEVQKPFGNGMAPASGTVDGIFYDQILSSGDYKVAELKGLVLVAGAARLLVTKKIEFKGGTEGDGIDFAPGGYLELYMEGSETKLAGKKKKKSKPSLKLGINEGGNATNFFYFGLKKNTKVELANVDEFNGIIYAPNAEVKLKAGSLKYYSFQAAGTIQGYKVEIEKNANFHYDENIGSLPADGYVVESWAEL